MHLSTLDWAILALFFLVSLVIGLWASRRSSRDFAAFFLGGRTMPWWLLGVSMVATTFATDTPNLVTDLVRSSGTFGNWTWWAFLLTGMLTVFVYAKLWRRSEVLTDIEFYEIRYSGKAAAFLRGFRAVYLGVFFNVIIMANVTLAAIKIGGVLMGLDPWETVLVAATITMVYSALGGLTGVLLTDFLQFLIAMSGAVLAAFYLVNIPEVGGLDALLSSPQVRDHLAFWPSFETMTWQDMVPVFVIPLAVQWWAAYYPGAEPGGGGFVVQRMLSAKDERHAVGATFLFNISHYALRPWPWILVALASLIVFPTLDSIQAQFPHLPEHIIRNDLAYPAMLTLLPSGLMGLVVTSLAAAYMSTMSTQVNWGASIIVNDVYRRFFRPDAGERRQVWVGRIATVGLMVLGCGLALVLESALQGFEILLQIGAGTGLLLLLRWFWWRINAYCEITAMVVSFLVAVYFQFFGGESLASWEKLVIGVGITTVCWVAVAYVTRPTDHNVLRAFYEHIRPTGPGWKPVLEQARRDGNPLEPGERDELPIAILCAALGTVSIYALLFASGFFLYGRMLAGSVLAVVAVGTGVAIVGLWPRLRFER
ncbi:MAG TPA: sodium:solute symporter family protein [Rhodothermales bacterium]